MATLSGEDEGKFLMDSEGEQLGIVSEVRSGTAYVDPDPNLGEAWLEVFGWGSADDDDLAVPASIVDTVTDKEIRVNKDL
ncbi:MULTISPECIES: hypothetical protein [unclassified Haladaptatus]|uniref:hypothetical protein n=1 Tax=unclassified Haladaptatus TaxID=2622732 RepID=UPI00209C075E|nr:MULTISPECIES: hypothetical protein [unclassified Haladaptatus]MCO8245539.1 hypothetical protein [Haladaptatus sp. AB643]MCO8255366.1 hypothetical protein [Haladaptatus sp. AB618]